MAALDCIKQLVKDTGDRSLVVNAANENWTDNGALRFLNEGADWLDQHMIKKPKAWLYKPVAAGVSLVTFSVPRWIKEVWIASASHRRKLTLRTQASIRAQYHDVPLTEIENGHVAWWCPAEAMLAPEQHEEDETSLGNAGATDLDFLVYGDAYLTKAIIIMPPPDEARTLEILATWGSRTLTEPADENFWTVTRPAMLVKAAKLVREIQVFQNAERGQFYTASLMDDIRRLEDDMLREQNAVPLLYMRMI